MRRTRSCLLCLSLSACDTEPDLELPDEFVGETRDLEVYRHPSGVAVCGGTLAEWQNHVEEVGAFFGSSGPFGPFPVVVTGQSGVQPYCNDTDRPGCARYRPMLAVGDPWAIPHELAHLVDVRQTGSSRVPFWAEGIAEAWSDRGSSLPNRPALDDLLAESGRDVDYGSASHWVQWIADAYGPDRVAAFLRVSDRKDRPDERVAQFEEILGEPYAAVQMRFWQEAPLYYPGFGRCGATDHVLQAGGRLDFTVPLDCASDPGPFNKWPEGQVYSTRVIEIEAPGTYGMTADGGVTLLLPCDPSDDPVAAPRWAADERNIFKQGPDALPNPRGLKAGRYKLWVITTGDVPVELRIAMYRTQFLTAVVR